MIRFLALVLALFSGKAFKCMRLSRAFAAGLLLSFVATAVLANPSSALSITESDKVAISGGAQFWHEKPAKASIEQVSGAGYAARFMPLASEIMFDLQPQDRLWIRLDLDRKILSSEHWILWIPLPLVDSVTLYQAQADGKMKVLKAGDRISVASWPEPGRYPRFYFDLPAGKSSIYLQLQASTPLSLPLYIGTEVPAQAADRQGFLGMGLMIGVLVTLVLVCMVTAYTYRDRLYMLYGLYMLVLILAVCSYTGVAGYLFWDHSPNWTDASQGILAMITAGGTLYFIEALLSGRQFARRLSAVLLIFGASAIPLAVAYYFVPRSVGVVILGAFILAVSGIGLSLALRAWARGDQVGKWVFFAYTPLALAVLGAVARSYGWINVSCIVQYGVVVALLIEAPMMMVALHVRSRERHEIQTREQAMTTQDALTGLFTEIIFDDRIRQTLVRRTKHREDAAVVLISLVNYDAIAAAYGLPVAEQSILRCVIKLRRVLRDVDTVARVGNSLFGVIFEGESERGRVTEFGARLIAQGLMPLPGLVPEVILQFHVAAVVLRELSNSELGVKASLQALLASMSPRTRRPIRFLDLTSSQGTSGANEPPNPLTDLEAATAQASVSTMAAQSSAKTHPDAAVESSGLEWQSTAQEILAQTSANNFGQTR